MLALTLQRILKTGILLFGFFYVGALLWLFSKRIVYPYELDWIEGGLLGGVAQILAGHNLYSAPSMEYVPFLYAPGFFYTSALVANFFGLSLLALRLVSALASLVSLLAIALIVFRETKSWFWALVSAGLFAGLYPASRFWFDMARVDALFVMFFLLFLLSLQGGNSKGWQVAAGVFAAFTILTKQNGLTMCLPIMAIYFIFNWKSRLILPLTFALVFGGISLALILSSDGWYIFYCYTMTLLKPNIRVSYSIFDFINDFIVANTLIAALLSLLALALPFFRGAKERAWFWLVVFLSTTITSYVAKANVGAVNNVVMPTFAVFSILFGVCLAEMLNRLQGSSRSYRAAASVFFCLLGLVQLGQVFYDPSVYLPALDDYRNGERALRLAKKFDGDVYLPNSVIALMAGKAPFAHPSAIWDVLHTQDDVPAKTLLEGELKKAVSDQRFDAIVILPGFDFFPDLQKYYIHDQARYILLDDNWKEKADVYILP